MDGQSRTVRDKIDDYLIDEAEPQCLTADLAARHVDDAVTGVLLGSSDGRFDAVDEGEWRGAGILPARRLGLRRRH